MSLLQQSNMSVTYEREYCASGVRVCHFLFAKTIPGSRFPHYFMFLDGQITATELKIFINTNTTITKTDVKNYTSGWEWSLPLNWLFKKPNMVQVCYWLSQIISVELSTDMYILGNRWNSGLYCLGKTFCLLSRILVRWRGIRIIR